MPGLRIDRRAVVLTGPHLDAARAAVRLYVTTLDEVGRPTPRVLTELLEILSAPCPGGDSREAPPEQSEDMTTRQAAEALGMSERSVRRIAAGLGGRMVAGRLVLDAAAVHQHREGMNQ
jgi:hypothetical protein